MRLAMPSPASAEGRAGSAADDAWLRVAEAVAEEGGGGARKASAVAAARIAALVDAHAALRAREADAETRHFAALKELDAYSARLMDLQAHLRGASPKAGPEGTCAKRLLAVIADAIHDDAAVRLDPAADDDSYDDSDADGAR